MAIFEHLNSISGRLEMADIISGFLASVDESELSLVLLHLQGRVFPPWSEKELGIAESIMIKGLESVSGTSEAKIKGVFRKTGDLGLSSAEILVSKAQTTLYSEKLTLHKVQGNIEKMAQLSGKGSQDRKLAYLTELLSMAFPLESKYIVRLILGQLRLGVGPGIIRDAISGAYGVDPLLVEAAFNLTNDFGEVAKIAKDSGDEGLKGVSLRPGYPVKVMLAQKTEGISKALSDIGNVCFEVKYDGMRVQIHKISEDINLFTRRLENVSAQFPEIVNYARKNLKADSVIVEGEVVAIKSAHDRSPRPFQDLSRRIKRKYEIEKMVKNIPCEINLFDVLYVGGQSKLDTPFSDRRRLLSEIVEENDFFKLAKQLVCRDEKVIAAFYEEALKSGHEGIMAKNLDAPYKAGSRVGYMYKIKPVMESLDLVITGASWGEGRRAHWLASFLLSALDQKTGQLVSIGRMATGLTDEQFGEMTERLKPLITSQKGTEVELKPEVVVEVAYEEIQRSPTYDSGFALRFPRLVRIRVDKGVGDIDDVLRVEELLAKDS
ncbi:MAG: ATP-dependent DNA ligase [Pseudomonadota bacterium]